MKIFFPLAICILFLAACKVEVPPIQWGFVTKSTGAASDPNSPKTTLTSIQLKQLEAWLAAHQDGWKFEPSDVFSFTVLTLAHRDGKRTVVYLAGEKIWIKNHGRTLTAKERTEIQGILDFVAWQP